MALENMQAAYVKKAVKEVLLAKPAKIDTLIKTSLLKIMPNIQPSKNDKEIIKGIIQELIFNGQANVNNGLISLNLTYRVSSVEEDYRIQISDLMFNKQVFILGNQEQLSVGSERYPSLWKNFTLGQKVEVELVAEPDNKKDPLAVAVCIERKPYAYMLRSEAAKYHPIIKQANRKKYNIMTVGTVEMDEKLSAFKIFKLHLPNVEEFKEEIESL